jgi:SP family general alpha glucoside:H+ symporter-like MFS transporter
VLSGAHDILFQLIGKLFVGIAAGSAQMTTSVYMIEISPNRIRGGLATFQGVWGGICGVACSAMLQVANKRYPLLYKLPIYVCWGLSAVMICCITFVPESPWVYARWGNKEAALKSMARLYANVDGYDYEEEWGIIIRTLAHEKEVLSQQGATPLKDLFVGHNLKRTLLLVGLFFAQIWGGLSMISTYGTCELIDLRRSTTEIALKRLLQISSLSPVCLIPSSQVLS